jgi:hypothetical protein
MEAPLPLEQWERAELPAQLQRLSAALDRLDKKDTEVCAQRLLRWRWRHHACSAAANAQARPLD